MNCEELLKQFKENDVTFFSGVPDSTMKNWINFLNFKHEGITNIIATDEAEAVSIATGYHLATNKIGVVYMQNSGLAKAMDTLTSLTNKEVYSIPMILMIGCRGGEGDEPQHKKMGDIDSDLLELLNIPFLTFPYEEVSVKRIVEVVKDNQAPFALLVTEDFSSHIVLGKNGRYEYIREDVIEYIIDGVCDNTVFVSTTGKTSRELFELRVKKGEIPRDFYVVGSMGSASSITLGIALQTHKKVICLDGDGSVLMNMGSLATIGHYRPKNFYHIVFDNEGHESTGGQPTVSSTLKFTEIALACGYKKVLTINSIGELSSILLWLGREGPTLIVVKIISISRPDLGRSTKTPLENKQNFMEYLQK